MKVPTFCRAIFSKVSLRMSYYTGSPVTTMKNLSLLLLVARCS